MYVPGPPVQPHTVHDHASAPKVHDHPLPMNDFGSDYYGNHHGDRFYDEEEYGFDYGAGYHGLEEFDDDTDYFDFDDDVEDYYPEDHDYDKVSYGGHDYRFIQN